MTFSGPPRMDTNIVILDAKTLGDDIDLGALERLGSLTVFPNTLPGETARRIHGADIIITNKVVIDRQVMDANPSLKLICVAATGMNNIDREHAGLRGIVVKNVAGYSTESVVQMTFSHVLFLLNHHAYYDEFARTRWQGADIFTHTARPFFELAGKRWGIIGLGTIGRRVAETAAAFGCEVVYYSTSGRNNTDDYQRVELDELMRTSSSISVHAPFNSHTSNLIDYPVLSLMQDGAIIVNVGRGGIINEADLARILDQRTIYAGLDVVTREPIEPANPLLHIKNRDRLSITPHIAWTSIEARQRLISSIADNIKHFLSGT